VRLRKMVAFERFLARLVAYQPGVWLLKGGLVLQWRLGNQARTTKDLDMLLTAPIQDIHGALVQAALLELGNWWPHPSWSSPKSGLQSYPVTR